MGHGDSCGSRRRDRARSSGHDVVGNTRPLQREGFFPAAPEHERVAALEPDDATPAPRGFDHQRLDRGLRQGMASSALADEELLRFSRVAQHPVVDERVVQHQIGAPQPHDREPRQQAGIARSGADEGYVSGHGQESSGAFNKGMQLAEADRSAEASRSNVPGSRSYRALSARSSLGLRSSIGTFSRRQSSRVVRAISIQASRSPGNSASTASRTSAVRAGASPLVEIAIVTPSRRTVPLRNALAFAGSSTALTKTCRLSAAAATTAFTSGVAAATTSHTSSMSAGTKARWTSSMWGCPPVEMAEEISGAITRTCAPTATNCRSLPAATRPPPTSATLLPDRFKNSGKRSGISRSRTSPPKDTQKQKRPGNSRAPGPLVVRRWTRSRDDHRRACRLDRWHRGSQGAHATTAATHAGRSTDHDGPFLLLSWAFRQVVR